MPKVYSSLLNRAGVMTLVWATLQQLVVASSTYFIVAAIRAATAQQFEISMRFAILFVGSLILVFVPNTLSILWLQKWRLASFACFMDFFVSNNAGRATYAHSRDKNRFESWLTNESTVVFQSGVHILYDLYQISLSTLLNIAVIAWAIDARIAGWYMAAGVVLVLANWLWRGRIQLAAQADQEGRRGLNHVMLTAWENIFVGNQLNLKLWQKKLADRLRAAQEAAVGYDRTRTLVSSVTVSLALMIIATGNGLFLLANQNNMTAVAALLVTLPRQLQVVQNIFAFFGYCLSWQGVGRQFAELESVLSLGKQQKDLSSFVRLQDIAVSSAEGEQQFGRILDLSNSLLSKKSGRFTLRGRNGAGKSTLLSLLAESTGAESFCLPSNFSDLTFASEAMVSQSDGNRILTVMGEVSELRDVKYIFLDEWDANLDAENIQRMDTLIAALAEERVVIESRHRA